MEFLEGFEEDDDPRPLAATRTGDKAISDKSAGPPIINTSSTGGPIASTSGTAGVSARATASAASNDDDEDDVVLVGDGPRLQSMSGARHGISNGANDNDTTRRPSRPDGHPDASQTYGEAQPALSHLELDTGAPQMASQVGSSSGAWARPTSASTASTGATSIQPSSSFAHFQSTSDHHSSQNTHAPTGSPLYGPPLSSFGRVPLVQGTTNSSFSTSTPGSVTPSSMSGYRSPGANGQYHYNGQTNGQPLPPSTLPYPTSQHPRPYYQSPYESSFPQHSHQQQPSSFQSTSQGFNIPSPGFHLSNGMQAYSQPSGSGSTSYRRPAQLVSRPSANCAGNVIDLTEQDDNDSDDAQPGPSSQPNGHHHRIVAKQAPSDDEDEVKISAEKLGRGAAVTRPGIGKPGAGTSGNGGTDDDDDLQIIGENATEATNPVCIGQLTGVALILYPIAELAHKTQQQQQHGSPAPPPLPALMLRTTASSSSAPGLSGSPNETIKLYSAQTLENFGVVETRLANVLGPIMTRDNKRGLGIWIEARVMRTRENAPMMLPLVMLLFCHPHLVKPVAQMLEKGAVYLEHPPTYDPAMHNNFKYDNPHGGAISASAAAQRKQAAMNGFHSTYSGHANGLAGPRGNAAKSVEVQREQVEEMFKTIQSGADFGEMEPDPMVTTKLYPHQKQALAFLTDRERNRTVEEVLQRRKVSGTDTKGKEEAADELISLWRPRKDVYNRFIGWQNVVTEVEIGGGKAPPQCRGAILADDMGLGKTIVIISLIAGTLHAAREFADQPPTTAGAQEGAFDALAAHPLGKPVSLSEFKSPLYGQTGSFSIASGMPRKGGKKKKESKTLKKREDAEAARVARLKVRSRATLIVCPLSTVVNWESQIEEHVGLAGGAAGSKRRKGDKSGTVTPASGLSVYIYHGTNRTSDIACLANHDIVITTFSTLGAEYSKQARKDEQDEEGSSDSSDGGIEEIDSSGQPVRQKGKKRKRKKIEGDATSALQSIEWFRIVLDEAHMIKEHTTIQARAACELMAERRTCLTGTPLQNTLNDLFSLMRFLRLEPFTDRTVWTNYIGGPAKVGDPLGVSRLQLLMRHLALRRTKNSTDKDGNPILSIPPKNDELRLLAMDEQEKAFYISHHRRYKHNFETLAKSDTLLKNYCSILQEVLRLRQICVHMALVRDSEDAALARDGEDGGDIVSAIKAHGLSKPRALRLLALMRDTGAAQCDECSAEIASGGLEVAEEAMEDESSKKTKKGRPSKKNASTVKAEPEETGLSSAATIIVTRCQHLFCLSCFQKNVAVNYPEAVTATDRATCSICRDEISPVIDAVQIAPEEVANLGAGEGDDDDTCSRKHKRVVEHSTKIRSLVADLFPLSQNNPASDNYAGGTVDLEAYEPDPLYRPAPRESTKTVVFSQWTKLLDRCEDALAECSIKFERLDGSMNRPERSRALNTFKHDLACEVLLVSLRAGGVGLNLTHASRVFMMEPSWNPSVENQAVDRIHRLGQTRPVKMVRLVIKDSVETNMLEIQKRKSELASMSLSQTLSKAQLAERRLEDLRTLFK